MMEESSKMITDSGTRLSKVVEELQDLVVNIDNIRYVASFHSSKGIGQKDRGDGWR